MARRQYTMSPFGEALHPWFNKPDTKYNADGVFKCRHVVSGAEGAKMAEAIQEAAEAAFEEWKENDGSKLKPADRAKWSIYVPFEKDTDEDGSETGAYVFNYKQNAKIKLKDGSLKELSITVVDSKNNAVHKPVFSGSVVRLMYTMRPITMTSSKQVGVRLDFASVQVRKLSEGSGPKFGEVEDGYVEDPDEDGGSHGGDGEQSQVGEY